MVVVAIDGPSGAGKTTLADAVATDLDCPVVRVEDLYPGWDGLAEGVRLLVEQVLEPLCRGEVARYRETLPDGRSYVTYDMGPDGADDNRGPYLVPEGHYFFMGDNRDNSLDSRRSLEEGVGYVPAENLVGKALFTVFSTDGSSNWLLPWTWVSAARFNRIGESF